MNKVNATLIAPCGMNCALCVAHQRDKKQCQGCNGENHTKPNHCIKCVIKNCSVIKSNQSGMCYECDKLPCARLKQLDARYKKNYQMGMIENLKFIKEHGMDSFLKHEAERWTCKNCGEIICIHRDTCLKCNTSRK